MFNFGILPIFSFPLNTTDWSPNIHNEVYDLVVSTGHDAQHYM